MQQYSEFNQLSLSSKLELLSAFMIEALSEYCPKYGPEGQIVGETTTDPVDSFQSLGFDLYGNEWFLFYPDILCIIGPSEPLVLDRNTNKLIPLAQYNCGDRQIQKLTYDQFLYQATQFDQKSAEQYANLNAFLVKNKIFQEKDHQETRKQIDVKQFEPTFYNFNVGAHGDQFLCSKVKKLQERNPLAIENLYNQVMSGKYKSFKKIFTEDDVNKDDEGSENSDLSQLTPQQLEKLEQKMQIFIKN